MNRLADQPEAFDEAFSFNFRMEAALSDPPLSHQLALFSIQSALSPT
jgi:hypothetical protein